MKKDANDIGREDGPNGLRIETERLIGAADGVDDVLAHRNGTGRKKKRRGRRSDAAKLAGMALGKAKPIRGDDGKAWAAFPDGQTIPVRSRQFALWLASSWFEATGDAASDHVLRTAAGQFEAQAMFGGESAKVHVRCARVDDVVWVDLGAPGYVRITRDGWTVEEKSTVYFWRPSGFGDLPLPAKDGGIAVLREFWQLPDDDWRMMLAWLVGALNTGAPSYVLAVNGEQGSAKSTFCEVLKRILDPDDFGLRSKPKNPDDVWVAARGRRVLGYDNLSTLSREMMDALCCLASGKASAKRELYSDFDEAAVKAQRAIIINGIPDLCSGGDFADRCLSLTLARIPEESRRGEREMDAAIDAALPGILAWLYDAASVALRREAEVAGPWPRMADAARWIVASAPALDSTDEEMLDCLHRAGRQAQADVLQASSVARAVTEYLRGHSGGTMTTAEWYGALGSVLPDPKRPPKDWPQSARGLGSSLRRIAPGLRAVGINIEQKRDGNACVVTMTMGPGSSDGATETVQLPDDNSTFASMFDGESPEYGDSGGSEGETEDFTM